MDGWMDGGVHGAQTAGRGPMGVCQTQTEWIGCEINKNRWEVGQKVALGQQAGGMGGQSIVGGDGSPGWVVETTTGVHACEKIENLMKLVKKAELLGEHMVDRRWHWGHMTKKSPKWMMVGGGDQIGAHLCKNQRIGEMSMNSDEKW